MEIPSREVTALVLAGGSGTRVGGTVPKQLLDVGDGRTPLDLVLALYDCAPGVGSVVVVANPEFGGPTREIAGAHPKVSDVVPGGATRQASAMAGLARVETRWVLLHESARPLVGRGAVARCLERLASGARAVAAVSPTSDTVAELEGERIARAHPRGSLAWVQSPLGFETEYIRACYEKAAADGLDLPGETLAVVRYGDAPFDAVEGDERAFKITHPRDVRVLRALLAADG
jgi:2-C-methyl-D-erythritol 4-phosphate cytidylyltransferase